MILYKDVLDIIYENVRQMELYEKLLEEIRSKRIATEDTYNNYDMFKKNNHTITYSTGGFDNILYIYNYKTNVLEIKNFERIHLEEAYIHSTIIKTNYNNTTNIYKFLNFFHFYYCQYDWELVSYIDYFENNNEN